MDYVPDLKYFLQIKSLFVLMFAVVCSSIIEVKITLRNPGVPQ